MESIKSNTFTKSPSYHPVYCCGLSLLGRSVFLRTNAYLSMLNPRPVIWHGGRYAFDVWFVAGSGALPAWSGGRLGGQA